MQTLYVIIVCKSYRQIYLSKTSCCATVWVSVLDTLINTALWLLKQKYVAYYPSYDNLNFWGSL